jgi:hypothetical protein
VAPCYPGGFPAFTLRDAKGGIASVFVDETWDVRSLPVGPPDRAEAKAISSGFRFAPIVAPGSYEVLVSVGERDGTPRIALPLSGDDGHRRYLLGTVDVTP